MKLYVMSKCVNKCWLENGVCLGCKRTIEEIIAAGKKRPEERQRLSKTYSTRAEQLAFEEGIIFAKILYGIGVDDE